jgi:hypothetical protein
MNETKKRYASVKEIPSIYGKDLFTETSIRSRIYNDKAFKRKCVIKIEGKIVIDLDKFEDWIEGHRDEKEKE